MKKTLFYILLSFLLLAGCASSGISKTEESQETPTFIFPATVNEDGTLYFTCQNWDSDIYMLQTFTPEQKICILSLEQLDLEEIKITLPIKNDYAVILSNVNAENLRLTDYLLNKDSTMGSIISDYTFPYYLYQCYRGTDWEKMKVLYDTAEEAKKLMAEWDGKTNDHEYIQWEEMVEEYQNYQNLYLEDYNALTSLPMFYCYQFEIIFGRYATSYDEYGFAETYEFTKELITETFQTIDIQIGDKTYTQNIGELRLHAETYPEHLKKNNFFDYIKVTQWPAGPLTYPWGDGIIRMSEMKFTAEEDLTLTKLYMYESNATPLMANIIISDSDENVIVDSQWDLKSSINVEKGQQVSVRPIVQDTNAIQLEYGTRCCPVIEYMVGSETYYYMQEQNMDRWPDTYSGLWVRYAAVFDGLAEELKDYFTYYYPVHQEWREGLN